MIAPPTCFEEASELLVNIENLVIAANGPSRLAAEYASYIMRYLNIFNSVKVIAGDELQPYDL